MDNLTLQYGVNTFTIKLLSMNSKIICNKAEKNTENTLKTKISSFGCCEKTVVYSYIKLFYSSKMHKI